MEKCDDTKGEYFEISTNKSIEYKTLLISENLNTGPRNSVITAPLK